MTAPTVFHLRVRPQPPPPHRSINVCVDVIWLLLFVLRHASVSVVVAWVAALLLSRGSVITSFSLEKQTILDFAVAVLTVSKFLHWACVVATHAALLVEHPKLCVLPAAERPGAWCYATTITRKSALNFLITNIVVLVLGTAVYHLPPAVRHTKVHVYLTILLMYMDILVTSVATRSAFLEHAGDSDSKQQRAELQTCAYVRRLAKVFQRLLTSLFATQMIAAYAQNTQRFSLTSDMRVGLFALGSITVKVVVQEGIRHYVLRRRLHNARVLAVVVGIPTIAIDTQMRIALLRTHGTSMQLSGSVIMAIIEVLVRIVKTQFVQNQIRQQERIRGLKAERPSIPQRAVQLVRRISGGIDYSRKSTATSSRVSVVAGPAVRPQATRTASAIEFDSWKVRLLSHHAAEVYMDMLSEYVAMGCSYVVLFVFWDHPKYMLWMHTGKDAGVYEQPQTQGKLLVVGIQMVLEVGVDFVSCVIAAMSGVDLALLQRHGLFMAFFLIWASVGNIIISSNMLLRDDAD